jgi:PleD family two-component response regulator
MSDNHSKSTVLVVDDQPFNLTLLVTILQKEQYRVVIAESGEQALQQLAEDLPDIILLDVVMPGIDGFELCRQLKDDPKTAAIPVIFMTALTELEHKVRAFKLGGVDYITKPFQNEEVLARLNAHLTIRRLNRELQEKNDRLEGALEEIRTLQEIVPICSCCKKVRDDKGFWRQVEDYVTRHTGARFSHSYCPSCFEKEKAKIRNL